MDATKPCSNGQFIRCAIYSAIYPVQWYTWDGHGQTHLLDIPGPNIGPCCTMSWMCPHPQRIYPAPNYRGQPHGFEKNERVPLEVRCWNVRKQDPSICSRQIEPPTPYQGHRSYKIDRWRSGRRLGSYMACVSTWPPPFSRAHSYAGSQHRHVPAGPDDPLFRDFVPLPGQFQE